jgi:hypothetical protein
MPFYLGRDDRETAAGFTGAGRLDGGVEGQEIGLPGDGVDKLHHVADARGRVR